MLIVIFCDRETSLDCRCLTKQKVLDTIDVAVFSVFAATLIAVDINNIQVTRCSFTGRLDSDPDSTVHISGCPNEENMDISLMSNKVFVLVLIFNSIIGSF